MFRKLMGPIIVTLILISYFMFYITGIIQISGTPVFKLIGILVPIIFIGYSIFALIDRIKEIRKGEEDDIGKY